MLKVFLVEDESVVRESLKNNIPWTEYGFTFAGEASDGEMALPLIRKTSPDVLITDIKMPFMDGLSLCHIARKEFPSMKMIVMSGYDDFEYAKRAIQEGVNQYISKPVTRRSMKETLDSVRDKIESERSQQGYLMQYQLETQEYEQLQRREFLEKVLTGTMPVKDIYVEAGKLSLDISASAFSLILFSLKDKENPIDGVTSVSSDEYLTAVEKLMSYFLRFPSYILSRWSINTYIVIVKGEADTVEDYVKRGVDKITETCGDKSPHLDWYVTAGKVVERFSALEECFNDANHAFACRFFMTDQHILTEEMAEKYTSSQKDGDIENVDCSQLDLSVINGFLQAGKSSEASEFVSDYIAGFGEAMNSQVFRNYFALHMLFGTRGFLESIGVTDREIKETIYQIEKEYDLESEQMEDYLEKLIISAIELRDNTSDSRGNKLISDALNYINENYMYESCTLSSIAQALNVNSSYFSNIFSKEMNMTFVKFLTSKRLEKARELLSKKRMHTADVAAAVGYKDAHYFSFVFRKMYGMSPRDYRNQTS